MVPPRRHHFTVDHSGIGIADENSRKHIDADMSQLAERINVSLLALAADIAGGAADAVFRQDRQQNIAGALKIVGTLAAGGIV